MFARQRRRFMRRLPLLLAVMGPGVITACADNDAGGIATYAQAGAMYGTKLLWLLVVITFVLGIVQEMCARMGAVTQKGLGELIREEFGVGWTFFALVVMFFANVTTCIAEFAGIAAACEIFGASKYIVVPATAVLMWALVVSGSFRRIERIFLALSLVYATYVVSGVLAVRSPDSAFTWGRIGRDLLTPYYRPNHHLRDFILLAVAMIGTTITPWMQFFLQSTVVDKGIKVSHYRYQRLDVLVGAFITDFVAFFIVVATAATVYQGDGVAQIETAKEAAVALQPVAGGFAETLFAIGLLNASLLASAVLPLSTAYTFCESFGWEMGLSRNWSEARAFYGIYTFMIQISAGVALLPDLPLMRVMLLSQDVNGILLPVVLVFMLKLVNDRRIMGEHVNSRAYNVVAWVTVTAVIALTLILLVSQFIA